MRIDRDTVVTLACELRDCDGDLLEDEGTAVTYLHGGYGGIFAKVESALHGREPGHEVAVTLEPEDAFGDYDAELLRVEPRSKFPSDIEVGMRFEGVPGENEDDALIYTITDVTKDTVVVDGNHPLAGERLWFKGTVTSVRPATPEELEREDANAPGLTVTET
ncbi:FKBP-type peptidyl-prolyl cis-trans isomerase [Usitatibacter palustris]|uniref:peptidylprolyl isomerase n=1 Tax=Usitatibacter palustris TaxID=2732487 RepID=A0A6M4H4K5_9PROT|nr:peptidylprolyl isomerase [Usitatibacter palustris]QJR14390.1 FKBP-type peptidyl-prolyl cis-trans isomerase SlyD [Usitatibacter palustris]